MLRDKVTFEPNTPVAVTLQYAEGKICDGRFGQQVMWGLADNQVMFLDLDVAQKINMLEPKAGESIVITKLWNGQRTQAVRWDVALSNSSEKFRAAKESPGAAWVSPPRTPPSELEMQLAASLAQVQERKAAIERRPPTVAAPAPQPQGTGTNGPVAVPQPRQMAAPPVKATYAAAMTEFLLIAGRATRSAETTLGAEGGSVRFDSRDVAALATTLMIQAARDGFLTWRPE